MYASFWKIRNFVGAFLSLFLFASLLLTTASVAAESSIPQTDHTPTAPLSSPASPAQPRYISGVGLDNAYTIFYEDRNAPCGGASRIYFNQTTSGPLGFSATSTATNICDTHFLVKDWPITISTVTYAYRAWGSGTNSGSHNFYVSNDLVNWTLVTTFTFNHPSDGILYGFHDIVQLNGHYLGWVESAGGRTYIVRSDTGDDQWTVIAQVGGATADAAPLSLYFFPSITGPKPSGNFVLMELDGQLTYAKLYLAGDYRGAFMAINRAAAQAATSADAEAAFMNPLDWTWRDGTTGLPAAADTAIASTIGSGGHDVREAWTVPESDYHADHASLYTADYAAGAKGLGWMAPPPPSTVWVDDNYNAVGCTADGHTWGRDCFATIQNGINAVASGGTVNVASGTYTEQVTITQNMTLLGAGAASTTVQEPASLTDSEDCSSFGVTNRKSLMTISGAGVNAEVTGFTLNGLGGTALNSAIYVRDGATANIHNNILSNLGTGDGSLGIIVGRKSCGTTGTATIANNTISGYGKGGLVIDNTGSSATIITNTITGIGATPNSAQNGVQISRGATATVTGNTISDHICTQIAGGCTDDPRASLTADGAAGILLYASGPGVTITNNFLNQNQFGIWTVAAVDAVISGNTLTGTATTGITATGIAIWDSDQWTIGQGYTQTGTTANVNHNALSTHGYGLLVRDYTPGGVAPIVQAFNNSFINDSVYGAWSDVSLDASGNWWGNNTPSGVASQVSSNTDYTPWLNGGMDTSANPGFQGDFSVLWVDAASPQTGSLGRIQEGVNAVATGGTVNIAAGAYPESLLISKPLILQSSSGAASTIINGGDPYSVFITSRDVTVDGFTITNPGYTGGSDAAGIVVEPNPYGSNVRVRITNNLIHDIGSPGRTSVSYGNCGINIGFADGVEIDHNEIYNIIHNDPNAWANGVCIWGGDSTTPSDHITIHGNSFHDISSPYGADAAISTQTDVGMNVIVFNNSIVSTSGHPTEFGVQVLGTNTVDASGNWWGTNTPSGVAALVTANVDYTPWLNSGTDTSANPGFQGDFSALWVDAASPQTGATGRIQEGANRVATSGIVNVASGTYTENVVISQSLTLAGAGQSNTTVYPALTNPDCRFGGSGVFCAGALTTTASIMALIQANNVVIHDLTLDGDNPALTSGIVVAGADLDARGGIITNQPLGTFNGLQIYTTTVKNIYLRGIETFNGGIGFDIHHNLIENVKGDPNASIAVFNRFGSGIFANNVVSGTSDAISSNWSIGTQYISNTITNSDSGIHSDNNGGAGGAADLIQGNQVSNCTTGGYGVWVFAPYLGVNVQNNIITGCDIGLGVFGQNAPATVNFTGNQVSGRTGSTGVYVTTDQLGFGANNVSAAFTNNQINNNTDGIRLESQTGYTLSVIAAQNAISGNTNAVNLIGVGTANALIKGNTIVTNTTVFSQSDGVLTAYANNITNFTTGVITTGGTYNIRHNWWGKYSDPAPSGVNATDWQARLGAPVDTWADGNNGTALGNANLNGGTGTAVIVSHGRIAANAPFGNAIAPYLCSDYYDFFTANASGTWTVTVPIDNTADCNSQVRDPGKVFWIPYPLPDPAHWAPVTTNIITRSQVIAVVNLAPTDLGGTPFVAGLGSNPTAITLIDFSAASTSTNYVLLIVLPIVLASIIVGLRVRRKVRI